MNNVFKKVSDNALLIEVSKELYQKEAILSAAQRFTDKCYVQIEDPSQELLRILLKSKRDVIQMNKLASDFCNEVLDEQVRLNVEKSYGNIRDLIIKQAFQPIEHIEREIRAT